MSKSIRTQQAVQSSMAVPVHPLGVEYERIHPTTRHVIQALFLPGTRGCDFVRSLMANATIMPYVMPHIPEETRKDAAIVYTSNGCVGLSQLVRMSYETTNMYFIFCRTIGLLFESKWGEQTTIIIPLDAFCLSSELIERLREIQGHYDNKRPTLRRLIAHAIEVLESLKQREEEQKCFAQQRQMLGQRDSISWSAEFYTRAQHILARWGVEDHEGQIAMDIAKNLAQLISFDLSKSPQNINRFTSIHQPLRRQECESQVDLRMVESSLLDKTLSRPGRFSTPNLTESNQPEEAGITSGESTSTASSLGRGTCGALISNNLPQGDIEALDSFDINVTFNDYSNVIYLMKSNVTLRERFQQFLASILDDDETQWRRYNRLFRDLSLDTPLHSQAIIAALLETLVLRYRDQSLTKPGGYFTSRCRIYRSGIPDFVCDLMKTYEHMTYEELVLSLKKEAVSHKPQVFSSKRKNEQTASMRSPSSFPAQSIGERCNELAKKQMSELEAKALEVQIKRQAPFVQVQNIRRAFQTGYVLDVSIDGIPWTFASKQEWDRYYDELHTCEQYTNQILETQETVQIYSDSVQLQ
jgi:hypothetical protein